MTLTEQRTANYDIYSTRIIAAIRCQQPTAKGSYTGLIVDVDITWLGWMVSALVTGRPKKGLVSIESSAMASSQEQKETTRFLFFFFSITTSPASLPLRRKSLIRGVLKSIFLIHQPYSKSARCWRIDKEVQNTFRELEQLFSVILYTH